MRVELGPVGALKPAGPRGGDLVRGERGSSLDMALRTGDLSRGVDFAESLVGIEVGGRGDLSREYGERALGRSSAEYAVDALL